ncbi:MAG: hypothetical protein H6Q05_3768 [Acidobacteria bacterium]|nr:hypothetical protein [Acidobacteriota bacterium]
MRHCLLRLSTTMLLLAVACLPGYAQGGGSLASLIGTVVDQSGSVIPGADVKIRNNATGAEATTITTEQGIFNIPSLSPGTYTATVSMASFKQSVIQDVVLVAGTPTTIRVTLVVGGSSETVIVQAGTEIVQSSTATVATTLAISQIANLPMATRNVMDFLVMLPGVNTTGGARNSSFSNMPGTAVNITVDGVNTKDNIFADSFFSYISPRQDAMQEVTVSTATPGSESSGTGAVQIRFITRSGSNDFNGSVYWYHRNPSLNSNYWFNNRDLTPVYSDDPGKGQPCTAEQVANEFDKCKAPRTRVLFNQPGFRVGGPIIIPGLFDGRDKALFFLNYEEFRLPAQMRRSRTIYNPLVDGGTYVYLYQKSGQPDEVRTVNLLSLAAANGHTSTMDPTVQKMLVDIRNSSKCSYCTVQSYPIVSNPLYENLLFNAGGGQVRKFPTVRLDFNLTTKHRLEGSWNYSWYDSKPDMLNSVDPAYPDFPNTGSQTSNRFSTSVALRSTLTPRLVNEGRVGFNGGTVLFSLGVEAANFSGDVANMDGFGWGLSGITTPYVSRSPSRRNSPVTMFEDTLSWTKGSHSLSFGGTWTNYASWMWNQTVVPTVSFGLPSAYDPAYIMFDATNGPKNFPGATTSQISTAASVYASLTGRVTSIGGTAYINEETGKYVYYGEYIRRARQREFGVFAQDSWRMKPGLTVNYGVRWEFQRPWTPLNNSYSWTTPTEVWGPSGEGNLMKPGSTGGVPSVVYLYNPGDPAYNQDWGSISPSFGFAWTPGARDGALGRMLGGSGQTVLRGGFGIAFHRNSMGTYNDIFSGNVGGSIGANRNETLGNLIPPGGSYPLLFRDKSLLGAPDFPEEPVYPMEVGIQNSIYAIDADIRVPYTLSWTFGIQREITRDTAIEVRYVGNKTLQGWQNLNYNSTEYNMLENGWLDEFYLAQKNVYANLAANRGKNFRYFGTGTGTYPLPIIMAYLSGGLDPNDPANYTAAKLGSAQYGFFTNATYNNYLSSYSPAPSSMASTLRGDAVRRDNALNAGLPANFFRLNETVSGAYIRTNGGWSKFDSMQVEVRRRMSKGLMVSANYVWGRGFDSDLLSFRRPLDRNLDGYLPHAFKANWMYELPFGQGKTLANSVGRTLDRIIGGWEFHGSTRIQCCNLLDFGETVLHGMTEQELRDSIGIWYDDANKKIYYYPKDIIDESYKAASYDVVGFTRGTPTGRYLAPANSGGCYAVVEGDCVNRHLYFRGPSFMRFDLSVVKRIRFTEKANFELRGEFLNAFNNANFYGTSGWGGLSSGQITSAYTDSNQQQDPGGRLIQIVMRFNF